MHREKYIKLYIYIYKLKYIKLIQRWTLRLTIRVNGEKAQGLTNTAKTISICPNRAGLEKSSDLIFNLLQENLQ